MGVSLTMHTHCFKQDLESQKFTFSSRASLLAIDLSSSTIDSQKFVNKTCCPRISEGRTRVVCLVAVWLAFMVSVGDVGLGGFGGPLVPGFVYATTADT